MAPLYEAVMNRTKINGKNVSVHINIYERLPVDKRLVHGKCSNLFDDYEIILLEKDSPSSMLKQVSAAMERRYLIQLPQVNISFSDSNLKQDQSTRSKINGAYIYLLQKTLLDVCKILRLNNCPQIWFFPDYFSAGKCPHSAFCGWAGHFFADIRKGRMMITMPSHSFSTQTIMRYLCFSTK